METTLRPLTHVDCFSGPGGFCTGLHSAGFKTLLAVEKVESCAVTYSANHPEVPVFRGDIRTLTGEHARSLIGDAQVDLLTSGMPCETFSTAGSKSRSFYDHRQELYKEAIRLAVALDARVILFENVPAITTKRVAKDSSELLIDSIFSSLTDAGYGHFVDTILDAAHFGVPQKRERFFILASREPLDLRVPVASAKSKTTVNEAFSGLPDVEANGSQATRIEGHLSDYARLMRDSDFWRGPSMNGELSYHIPPKHRPATLRRFALLEPGEGLRDLFLKYDSETVRMLQDERVLPKRWYIQRNRRLRGDSLAPTVTSHCLDELVHPVSNRALTVREVARLQGFPDFYDFAGGPMICPHVYETQDKYEQIGDAVPPLLARAWGEAIRQTLAG